jgi:hypothetical protein
MKPAHELAPPPPPRPKGREIRIMMSFEGNVRPAVLTEPTDVEIAAYDKALKGLRPGQEVTLRRSRDGRSSTLVIETADEEIPVVQ